MGMLETRLLDFDTVILTQANEGILPAKSIDDSWIPYDMKKQFGLPTRDEKNAIFSYHFYRLMYRAKKVYILYDGQGDGLGGGEMSRFVRQWATRLPENHSMRFFNQSVTLNTVTRQRLEIPKTPSLLKRLQEMAQKGAVCYSIIELYCRPNPILQQLCSSHFGERRIGGVDCLSYFRNGYSQHFGGIVHALCCETIDGSEH